MDDDNAICGLDKLSKELDDGSLVPNENTKYFKCVTKKRKESDFTGREISEDDSNQEATSGTGNNWDGKIVLSRRTPVGYHDFSKIQFIIYGLTKRSDAEDMTLKFDYTDQDNLGVGTCDSTDPSFDINGYKYYGIHFNSTSQPHLNINNVRWSPNKRINNSFTGNEFDLYHNNSPTSVVSEEKKGGL